MVCTIPGHASPCRCPKISSMKDVLRPAKRMLSFLFDVPVLPLPPSPPPSFLFLCPSVSPTLPHTRARSLALIHPPFLSFKFFFFPSHTSLHTSPHSLFSLFFSPMARRSSARLSWLAVSCWRRCRSPSLRRTCAALVQGGTRLPVASRVGEGLLSW